MSGEHREAVGMQAHPAQPRTLGELGHEPEHGTSPPTSPASAAELPGAAPGTHAQAAAEVVSTPAQSHTIKVPPREEVLATRVAPRRRRRVRPVMITAGLLTTLGLGWTGGMNAERLASLDLPGRAAALATAAAHETRTWLQTAADAVRTQSSSKEPGGTTEGSAARTAAEVPGPQGEARPSQDLSSTDRGIADLAIKVDQVRAASEEAARDLATRLDQFRDSTEQRGTELSAKLARLEEQVGRVERQLQASSLTKAAQPETTMLTSPAAPPMQRPPAAAEKAAPKPPSSEVKAVEPRLIKNWRVREVLDGVAILEGPKGFIQVQRGDRVPGVGPVETIQRRGKGWVVITSNGVITMN